MMALSDGIYTFNNLAFPSSQPTLSNNDPSGNIVGSIGSNQQWIVRNSGSVITVKSGIPKITSFASVSDPVRGAPLVGSSNTFNWIAKAVPGGEGWVYITAPGTDLAWNLADDKDKAKIDLQSVSISNIPSAAQWIPAKQ